MTFKSLLKQFILYYIGLTLLLSGIATFFEIKIPSSAFMVSISIIIQHLVSEYMIKNRRLLEKKEYWKIFFSFFVVFIVHSFLIFLILFQFFAFNLKIVLVGLLITIIFDVLSLFIGLWGAKRRAKKILKKKNIEQVQVYAVTDEIIANYLVSLLQKSNILANIVNNYSKNSSFSSVDGLGNVAIMLHKKEDYNKALEIITSFFDKQKEQKAWICPKCKVSVDEGYTTCWNCQHEYEESNNQEGSKKENKEESLVCMNCDSTNISIYPKYYQCDDCLRKYKLRTLLKLTNNLIEETKKEEKSYKFFSFINLMIISIILLLSYLLFFTFSTIKENNIQRVNQRELLKLREEPVHIPIPKVVKVEEELSESSTELNNKKKNISIIKENIKEVEQPLVRSNKIIKSEIKHSIDKSTLYVGINEVIQKLKYLRKYPNDTDVLYVGIWDSENEDRSVTLNIRKTDKPIVLLLQSHKAVVWKVKNPYNVEIKAIVMNSKRTYSTIRNVSKEVSIFHIMSRMGEGYDESLTPICKCRRSGMKCSAGFRLSRAGNFLLTHHKLNGFSGKMRADLINVPQIYLKEKVFLKIKKQINLYEKMHRECLDKSIRDLKIEL